MSDEKLLSQSDVESIMDDALNKLQEGSLSAFQQAFEQVEKAIADGRVKDVDFNPEFYLDGAQVVVKTKASQLLPEFDKYYHNKLTEIEEAKKPKPVLLRESENSEPSEDKKQKDEKEQKTGNEHRARK